MRKRAALLGLFLFATACNRSNTSQSLAVRGSAGLVGTVSAVASDGSRVPVAGVSIGVLQCIPGTGEVGPYWSQCGWESSGNAVSTADGTYSITTLYFGGGTVFASGTGLVDYTKDVSLPTGTTRLDIEMVRMQ